MLSKFYIRAQQHVRKRSTSTIKSAQKSSNVDHISIPITTGSVRDEMEQAFLEQQSILRLHQNSNFSQASKNSIARRGTNDLIATQTLDSEPLTINIKRSQSCKHDPTKVSPVNQNLVNRSRNDFRYGTPKNSADRFNLPLSPQSGKAMTGHLTNHSSQDRCSRSVLLGPKKIEKINNSLGKLCQMLDISDDDEDYQKLTVPSPHHTNSVKLRQEKRAVITKAASNLQKMNDGRTS